MEHTINNIWSEFNNGLHQLICRKTNHHDDCHDILQDVYIKIILNIGKIEKAENIKSYLLKIADTTVIDYHRAKSSSAGKIYNDSQSLQSFDPEIDKLSLTLADCCLRPMIESMEPIYRQALIMTDLEGMTQKQYAEEAGISLSGAKSRIQRAREKLKNVILNCCTYTFDKYGNILSCKKNSENCCK